MISQLVVLMVSFLGLCFLGLPIFVCMGLSSVVYCTVFWGSTAFTTISSNIVEFLNSLSFLCLPFFVLAGDLMIAAGLAGRLIKFSTAAIGHIRGGLSHVTVLVCIVFSGVSGSVFADLSAVGSVLIPAMKKEGYPASYAATVAAASATLGPIIPPSIPLVIYGALTEQSVGRLFLGGAIPGLVLGFYLLVTSYFISKKRNFPQQARASWRELGKSAVDAILGLMMPVIIIGGIVSGIVTVTEAGVLAVVYALIIGLFVYKELRFKDLPRIFSKSMLVSAYVMIVLASAGIFSYLIAEMRAGELLLHFFTSISQSKWVIMAYINAFFLIWGCLLDPMVGLVVVVPALMPLIKSIGIDPIHFGVTIVLNLMIGLFTPPVGFGLYLAAAMAGEDFKTTVREVPPFLVPLILALVCTIFFPELTLWLPRVLLG